MPQSGVGPQDALGRDALAGLAEVHRDRAPEEVLELVAVRVGGDPRGGRGGQGAVEHDAGEVDERDVVQAGGVEPRDVVLVPEEDDAGDSALELGDGGHRLRDRPVQVRVRVAVRAVPVERRQAVVVVEVAAVRVLVSSSSTSTSSKGAAGISTAVLG